MALGGSSLDKALKGPYEALNSSRGLIRGLLRGLLRALGGLRTKGLKGPIQAHQGRKQPSRPCRPLKGLVRPVRAL